MEQSPNIWCNVLLVGWLSQEISATIYEPQGEFVLRYINLKDVWPTGDRYVDFAVSSDPNVQNDVLYGMNESDDRGDNLIGESTSCEVP